MKVHEALKAQPGCARPMPTGQIQQGLPVWRPWETAQFGEGSIRTIVFCQADKSTYGCKGDLRKVGFWPGAEG